MQLNFVLDLKYDISDGDFGFKRLVCKDRVLLTLGISRALRVRYFFKGTGRRRDSMASGMGL